MPYGADLVFLLNSRADGVYEVTPRIPSQGNGEGCWWEDDLTGIQKEKAKVNLGKSTKVLNIVNSDQGRFITYEVYSNALCARIKKGSTR